MFQLNTPGLPCTYGHGPRLEIRQFSRRPCSFEWEMVVRNQDQDNRYIQGYRGVITSKPHHRTHKSNIFFDKVIKFILISPILTQYKSSPLFPHFFPHSYHENLISKKNTQFIRSFVQFCNTHKIVSNSLWTIVPFCL